VFTPCPVTIVVAAALFFVSVARAANGPSGPPPLPLLQGFHQVYRVIPIPLKKTAAMLAIELPGPAQPALTPKFAPLRPLCPRQDKLE